MIEMGRLFHPIVLIMVFLHVGDESGIMVWCRWCVLASRRLEGKVLQGDRCTA